MCGIHGFINGEKKVELNSDDFVKQGFIVNMVRGVDSSGIGLVDANGYNNYHKLPVPGMYFPTDKMASSLISAVRNKSTAAMCHVRAATVGGVSYQNAHPFVLEDENGKTIVGMHNGTLTGWAGKEHAKDFKVDSEWAMYHILLNGTKAFEDFTGAFAMVWWIDETPGVIYMARNKERPIHVAWTEDGNMVYASEAGMLHWLCERNNIKLVGSIKSLEEGKLYEFDISDPTKFTKSDLPVAKVTSYPAYRSGYYNDWYGGSRSSRYYPTVMEKLNIVFDKIKKEMEASGVQVEVNKDQDNGRTSNDSQVTREEMEDALSMSILGAVGSFRPYGCDDRTGQLYGAFECEEYTGELNAVMRNAEDVDWSNVSDFTVSIQGIKDNGNEFLAIVSRPIKTAVEV